MLGDVVARAFDTLSGTVGGVFTTLSVILIAAYLLADGERFKLGTIRLLPVQYRDDALVLFSDVIEALSRYLSGLLVSLTFQGVASTIALTLLGVPFAILLGIWTAIGAIVPFIGSYIGGIPATIVAFTVSPTTGILTALTYVLINFIDGNLIAPRVQGNAIRVSPLFVFLAVIAGWADCRNLGRADGGADPGRGPRRLRLPDGAGGGGAANAGPVAGRPRGASRRRHDDNRSRR